MAFTLGHSQQMAAAGRSPRSANHSARVLSRPRAVASARGAASTLERLDTEYVDATGQGIHHIATDDPFHLEFAQYRQATQQVEDLDSLSDALLSNMADLDMMMVAQPPANVSAPTRKPKASPADAEARREARKAAREARKVEQGMDEQPASTSGRGLAALIPASARSSSKTGSKTQPARSSTSSTQRAAAPTMAAASTSAPMSAESVAATHAAMELQQRQGQLSVLQAGPSLALSSQPSAARARHETRASRYSSRAAVPVVEVVTKKGRGENSYKSLSSKPLQADQQKELAAVVKDYLTLQRVKAQLKSILKREPSTAEWAKAVGQDVHVFSQRLATGNHAKTQMLKSNERLVINIVKNYRNRGLDMADLIAEGMQGLLRGVEKYDADKGFRFSTYAHWWIRQAVTRSLANQTRAVRLPHHVQEIIVKIKTVEASLKKKLSRTPSIGELSEALDLPVERIKEYLAMANQATSLETPTKDGEDSMGELKDHLADERATPDEAFEEEQMQGALATVLGELDEREADILRMRLGIDGCEMHTLEDIGRHFNVTRERVRQVEAKAMHKLQDLAEMGGLFINDFEGSGPSSKMGGAKQATVSRVSRGTKKT